MCAGRKGTKARGSGASEVWNEKEMYSLYVCLCNSVVYMDICSLTYRY